MRPFQEIYEWKLYHYHPGRTVKSQRITFYHLSYEIYMMIYMKDTCKSPFSDEFIDRNAEDTEGKAEAAMPEAMENFLHGQAGNGVSSGSIYQDFGTTYFLDVGGPAASSARGCAQLNSSESGSDNG